MAHNRGDFYAFGLKYVKSRLFAKKILHCFGWFLILLKILSLKMKKYGRTII